MGYFRGSDFHPLFQPSYCKIRVWMFENYAELAADDSAFRDLLISRGKIIKNRHLAELDQYEIPEYRLGDWKAGLNATLALLNKKTPAIYQPVLLNEESGYLTIPDFLIAAPDGSYIIRDVKLAVNLKDHPEIGLQMGLARMAFAKTIGYLPNIEIVTGDGCVQLFDAAAEEDVSLFIQTIHELRRQKEPPLEPVGWSKCNPCVFGGHCWTQAIEQKDIATVPYVDQGAWKALTAQGCNNYEDLNEFSEELLADLNRPWGKGYQRIGGLTAAKIKQQVRALISQEDILATKPPLPAGYCSRQRPVVMFDIENDVFDPDLGVKVYLWGCLIAEKESTLPTIIVSGQGTEGDRQGWFEFLQYSVWLFARYGDIPFVHYSSHEKTWVTKYIERYGDLNNTGARILANLWDMCPCIEKNFFLPIYSYGLKHIEKLAGFKRTQEEFGGLWSITMYDRYLNAPSPKEQENIMSEIIQYNTEDLYASLAVYEWLEQKIANC